MVLVIYRTELSNNTPVYFDDLKIIHDRGRILDKNDYYPYGLKIAPISSRALPLPNTVAPSEGVTKNDYQYQGAYSEFDDDLKWNSFDLRDYDPQLGRWLQQDPYQQFATPYVGMGGDPVNNVDPSGGRD